MKITNQFKSRLRTYFIKRLGGRDYRHGWMRIPTCPYCGREEKLGVNLSMYRTNCFRCNAHPSPAQLIRDHSGRFRRNRRHLDRTRRYDPPRHRSRSTPWRE